MEELDRQLEKLRDRKQKIAAKIRKEIDELDKQRAVLLKKLQEVEGVNGTRTQSIRRYGIPEKIMEIVEETGKNGMASAEIFTAVRDEIPDFTKENTSTHINRLKNKGKLKAKGSQGSYKYYVPASAKAS